MYRAIIFIVCVAACFTFIKGEVFYRDYLTGFSDISKYAEESGFLEIHNTSSRPIFETRTFDTDSKIFSYQLRAMTNDRNPKSRFFANNKANTYGIVWNFHDSDNYEALKISWRNSSPYDDVINQKSLELELQSISNGKTKSILKKQITENVSTDGNYNSIQILFDGRNKLTVKIGDKYLKEVAVIDNASFGKSSNIGYFVEKDAQISVRRILFKSEPNKEDLHKTEYTQSKLDSIFEHSRDPNEGYWRYLDRNMDETLMKLGGKYRIAVVRVDDGYELLYAGGATTLSNLWQPYMLKGKLTATPFIDNYDLVWHNAKKEPISDEAYAFFSENILTLKMPLLKAEVRFYKVVQ